MNTLDFKFRHNGINEAEKTRMLETLGVSSIEELIDQTIPADIRLKKPLALPKALSEQEYAEEIAQIASQNRVFCLIYRYGVVRYRYSGSNIQKRFRKSGMVHILHPVSS